MIYIQYVTEYYKQTNVKLMETLKKEKNNRLKLKQRYGDTLTVFGEKQTNTEEWKGGESE